MSLVESEKETEMSQGNSQLLLQKARFQPIMWLKRVAEHVAAMKEISP